MNDTDKLAKVREYVERMSPIIRPAVLYAPLEMAEHRGYDQAMYDAQQKLLKILDAE